MKIRNILLAACLAATSVGAVAMPHDANAATIADLNQDSSQALQRLIHSNSAAAAVYSKSRAVLIFPSIVKAGLIFGGAYGEGELKTGSTIDSYYNSFTASWGLQAGAQSYGYVVFLMNDKALNYIHQTHGWEIGVGPTVVLVDQGVAKNLSSTTLQDDAYAFIFDQKGLMAGVSIEGTKITRVQAP
jgi:lipid-binding SYLF domain-containing protein